MSRPRILDEDRLTLEEARPLIGTGGKSCDFATIYRAVTRGHLLPDGKRHRLEAVRIGGKWVTSRQAIEIEITVEEAALLVDDLIAAKPSREPMGAFLEDLDALLRGWNDRTGGHWKETIRFSFVDEEPEEGYARQRRGPQVKIALTLTDTTRAGELAAAHFQDGTSADSLPAASLDGQAVTDEG